MAEYMAGMAMAALNPDERKVMGWKGMLAGWKGRAKECASAGPINSANMLGGEKAYDDRQCLLYNRGPLVLHMFRTSVGDQAFYAVMRKLLETTLEPATVEDVKEACKGTLRADMGWFWDEWIQKGGIPEVRFTYKVESAGGRPVLTGRVEQAPASFIKMTIPLIIDYADGKRDVRVFVQDDWNKGFRFELPAVPKKVTIDPANNNLAVYR
jgi:aminopeptidase N